MATRKHRSAEVPPPASSQALPPVQSLRPDGDCTCTPGVQCAACRRWDKDRSLRQAAEERLLQYTRRGPR